MEIEKELNENLLTCPECLNEIVSCEIIKLEDFGIEEYDFKQVYICDKCNARTEIYTKK